MPYVPWNRMTAGQKRVARKGSRGTKRFVRARTRYARKY